MTFHFKAIDHIQLAAPMGSEMEARKFFSEILGFTEIEKPEQLKKRGGVWFAFGNQQIHIGIEEPFAPAKKAHPAFEVDNIEALEQHLTKNNITITKDDNLPGAKRFYVSDPFGNRIEILEWV
ncbi:VOC family protein [Ureibacillus chungkukjangi]|uniref:Catechol 2,3-dioxygenase-like lactoylglutathione lyase family enzyme n=1 Tax=Ureibacillus chungkukjangi TaxID=1202712 RepID=A0A318TSE1_9BACL|nr:VOC family protein [Ureibacillus chungkukjangi]PYF06770.1 catechol 2,3-dioxygenase-like lactoylglutathione lyase family enzyme [Ureibacillus chungkukjangi]